MMRIKLSERIARYYYYQENPGVAQGSWSYLAKTNKDRYKRKAYDMLALLRQHLTDAPKPIDYNKELEL